MIPPSCWSDKRERCPAVTGGLLREYSQRCVLWGMRCHHEAGGSLGAMPHWGCREESQPGIELCAHHAVTAPLWTSPKDPCHHRHLWAVPLLVGLCHGTAIGMVIGHCSASDGTGHAGVGLGDSPRLGLFWWIQAFHAFVIFVSVHFHIRNP